MAFSRGVKCPIEIISNGLSSVGRSADYSTWACRGTSIFKYREIRISYPCGSSSSKPASGMFLRRFSAVVASSEQMNLIKLLRERTSAPIKDVKSALVDCNWDIDFAQKDLRKRGKVLASKKSSRTAVEGFLALAQDANKAAIIELNCETDFVARNEIFKYLALSLAKLVLSVGSPFGQMNAVFPVGLDSIMDLKVNLDHSTLSGQTTVQDAITEVAAIMGENVRLRRAFSVTATSDAILSSYLHTSPQTGLGRIAGLVSLLVEDNKSCLNALQHVGSELAMHVVAAKPLFLTKEYVSSDALESERDILKSQAEATGKSEMAIERMVEGRLRKYMEEVVLMEQKFVVNDTMSIKTVLDNLSNEVGSRVKIGSFFRVEVGEGLSRVEATDASGHLSQAV